MGVAGFLLVLYPKPCPLSPVSQAGKVLLWGCRATLLSCPQELGPLQGKGGEKEGSGRSRGWLVSETPTTTPHPPPQAGPGRGGLSPPPGGVAGSLLPPAGAPAKWARQPGPGSGVGCSWQCGGRGAGGRQGLLLITRPPSTGSDSHGQPGAPARRERHRPGREVGQSRACVAAPMGRGCWTDSLPPRTSTFGGCSGLAGVRQGAEPPGEGRWGRPGSGTWHLRLWLFIIPPPLSRPCEN